MYKPIYNNYHIYAKFAQFNDIFNPLSVKSFTNVKHFPQQIYRGNKTIDSLISRGNKTIVSLMRQYGNWHLCELLQE